jgi:hypothetical protein
MLDARERREQGTELTDGLQERLRIRSLFALPHQMRSRNQSSRETCLLRASLIAGRIVCVAQI